ncbi:unnamed protein product [Peronospora belbahrii]|uniref:RxLR effector protein n=1 Tax=Peronospora belbahrii TaxID=622444 RepID=A0AAU9KUY6_9STRA|nr:unnamed protein product [Peronospora belbahrii]CAH0514123.1 unnamed protein product [Peronospora belbahrii]
MRFGVFFPFLLVAMFIMSCSSFIAANSYSFDSTHTNSGKISFATTEGDEERDAKTEGGKRVAALGKSFLASDEKLSQAITKIAEASKKNEAMSVEKILEVGGLKDPKKVIKLLKKNNVNIEKALHDRDLGEIFKLVQVISVGKKKSLTKKMFIVLASLFGAGGVLYCLYILYNRNQAPPGQSTATVGNTASSEDSKGSDAAEFEKYLDLEGSGDSTDFVTLARGIDSSMESPEPVDTVDSAVYESSDSSLATEGAVGSSALLRLQDSATSSGSSDFSAVLGGQNMLNPKYMKATGLTKLSSMVETDSSTFSEPLESSTLRTSL